MGLETGTFVTDLVTTNPPTSDLESQGANHLQLIKTCLHNTFPDGSKAFFLPKSLNKSANYTVLNTDDNTIFYCDATGGSFTLTLPTPTNAGWRVRVVKVDSSANTVTVAPPAGTISGQATIVLAKQWQYDTFEFSNGTFVCGLSVAVGTGTLTATTVNSATVTATSFGGTPTFSGAVIFSSTISVIGKASFTSTDSMAVAKGTTAQRNGAPTSGDVRYNSTLNGLEWWNGTAWVVQGQAPTVQTFTSGAAQTYTPSAGVVRIRVRMCGGGGGGGAQATNAGTAGNSTSFGSWVANGGGAGAANGGAPGTGGTGGANGTGTLVVRLPGGDGQGGHTDAGGGTTTYTWPGGAGGSNPFGGGGAGVANAAGRNGATNTGAGGAGGGSNNTTQTPTGSGGAAGEYVEFWVTNPGSLSYTVGAAASGGAAGAKAGGSGAAGIIIVEEFYA